ncbi:MAG: WG repeat-containing protein [Pyrinomonadaceae bacterium]
MVNKHNNRLSKIQGGQENSLLVVALLICFATCTIQAQESSTILLSYKIDHLIGFADETGKAVIEPQFSNTRGFRNGFAAVAKARLWAYIDVPGKLITEYNYEDARDFSEGYAAVLIDGKWGYIDRNGKLIIRPRFSSAGEFRNGMAAVVPFGKGGVSSEKVGFVDLRGKLAVEAVYELAGDFNEGVAPVALNGKWGYIDKTGQWTITPKFQSAGAFSEGLAAVRLGEEMFYIDHGGTEVLYSEATSLGRFRDGVAKAWFERGGVDSCGYIDRQGRILVERIDFFECDEFYEGFARVRVRTVDESFRKHYAWGYLDKTGKMMIPAIYDSASRFENGTATVRINGIRMHIERNGRVIQTPDLKQEIPLITESQD